MKNENKESTTKKEIVEGILSGSFDLHVHSNPSPDNSSQLRLDALDTAHQAQEAGMAGFVLKSHYYPTVPVSEILTRIYSDVDVAGSISLNNEVGGLNPSAVESSALMGARVVWMPTISATYSDEKERLRLTDSKGDLLPVVHEIIELVKHHDMILASGHVSLAETLKLFQAASDTGVERMIITHPDINAELDLLIKIVGLGAYPEYTMLSCTPSRGRTTPSELVARIREIGVDRCVVTTDFGQWMNPSPAEGMRMAISELLFAGMEPDEVSSLVKGNPLELLQVTQRCP